MFNGLACESSKLDVSVRIRPRAPGFVSRIKQRVNPEVGVDPPWTRKYVGANPISLTMPVYANRQSGLP